MSTGKPPGSRRGPRQKAQLRLAPMLHAAGATIAIIAWGYLVWMAIDFGRSAKTGDAAQWALLALAAIGAMACLFTALMLIVRMLREIGAPTPTSTAQAPNDPLAPPPPPGGRRRA